MITVETVRTAVRRFVFVAAILCTSAYSYPAASNLPNDRVRAVAPGTDSALWVGTDSGLARLGRDGQWQVYTKTSTNGGLPNDNVRAVVPTEGVLWVGTDGGLARLGTDGQWQTYTKDQHQ